MTTVCVIGGGRWARTITGVLAGLPDAPENIILHSRHNIAGIREWVTQRNLAARVDISAAWPDYGLSKPHAVVVANRAADHAAAAAPALDSGVPVLVEKPMAIGAEAVRQLQERATGSGALLAASHVLLFARYFDAFVALVAKHGPVRRLDMVWQDGREDVVRGETKSYDPAVPVFDDVLPHILPMLARIAGRELSVASLAVEQGGAEVMLEATAHGVPMGIRLARNAESRRRSLAVETAGGTCLMNFSTEPGVLSAPGTPPHNGDPQWDGGALRPLGTMLTAFLHAARGGPLDPRLSSEGALASARFADAVRTRYHVQQQAWLTSRGSASPDEDLRYALQEISGQV